MTSHSQTESQPSEAPINGEKVADIIFTVIGIFLATLLTYYQREVTCFVYEIT